MDFLKLVVTLSALALSACASVNVSKVSASRYPMQLVCIEENLKVNVADIIEVLEEGFQRHSIDTLVYDGKAPEICEYTLWYTALRSWDFAPFLRHAELRLRHGQKVIASATFDQSIVAIVTKRASTGEKLNPVIDELLSNFRERVEWKKARKMGTDHDF